MLLSHTMRDSGGNLFRWRSYVLLAFLPLVALATMRGEPIEHALGEFWGESYEVACIALVAAGVALRAFTVGFVPARTSGRNTRSQVANSLNTTGMYSLTRNPLYLANSLIYMGVMLSTQDLLLSLAFGFFLCVYYERIILAEEAFLQDRFGAEFLSWVARTPVFLPRLSGWQRPEMPFSLRTVVRREYTTWLAAIVSLGLVDIVADLYAREVEVDIWRWIILGALALYCVIHLVKRHTRLLSEPGR